MNNNQTFAINITRKQLTTAFTTLTNERHKAWLRLEKLAAKEHGLDVCITDNHLEAKEYPRAQQQLARTKRALEKAQTHYDNLQDAAEYLGANLRQVCTQ